MFVFSVFWVLLLDLIPRPCGHGGDIFFASIFNCNSRALHVSAQCIVHHSRESQLRCQSKLHLARSHALPPPNHEEVHQNVTQTSPPSSRNVKKFRFPEIPGTVRLVSGNGNESNGSHPPGIIPAGLYLKNLSSGICSVKIPGGKLHVCTSP